MLGGLSQTDANRDLVLVVTLEVDLLD